MKDQQLKVLLEERRQEEKQIVEIAEEIDDDPTVAEVYRIIEYLACGKREKYIDVVPIYFSKCEHRVCTECANIPFVKELD